MMNVTPKDATTAVCIQFGMNMDQIRGVNARRCYARPRQIAMYLSRELTGISLPGLGTYFCRDHTTVLYAWRRIRRLVEKDSEAAQVIGSCKEMAKVIAGRRADAVLAAVKNVPLVREVA